MSSRALKRLQGASRLAELPGNDYDDLDNEDDDDLTSLPSQSSQKKLRNKITRENRSRDPEVAENPFELLDRNDEESAEPEKEEKVNDENQNTQQADKSQVKTKKKKKKSKAKKKENENTQIQQDPVDEVEASVQEVNRILGDPGIGPMQGLGGVSFSANVKPLLHIDYRHLNPEAELKRLFGSEVVRREQTNRNRRQRNRPLQRGSRLVQVRDTWHSTGGSGLSMKYMEETQEFVFEHSLAYQKLQHKFSDAVDSGHPENIINILRENPYHIDSLIQVADLHRMNEDYQTSAESIEKALYGQECAFHPLFNLASGHCYLNYKRAENRALYLCLFKHILNLGRRGCNRTAFEFCKLLLSLDPVGDPLDCMNIIDYYALRSEQYDHLIQLEQEIMSHDSMRQVPNFALSIPLAHFKIACRNAGETTKADQMLQDSLLFFPMILMPLLDECSVQPDKRVSIHPFFSTAELNNSTSELGRLVKLYVKRCVACWKEPEVMAWLERNVMIVLDIVDAGTDPRPQNYTKLRQQCFKHPPLSLLRHYFLSEIPGIGLPRQYLTAPVLNNDPFPPTDTIRAYTRTTRPTVASQDQSGFLTSLLRSLMPSYNPYEPADEARRRQLTVNDTDDDDEAGARAQGLQQQLHESVNAVMQAMRQLLADPFATLLPPAQEAAENQPELEDNDREWEDDVQE